MRRFSSIATRRYSIELEASVHFKIWIFVICKKLMKKKGKNQSLNTELDFSKIVSKKVISPAAEATGKILGEKIAE